jgi:RNA polymerase sigma factor (TIGR02999 family)
MSALTTIPDFFFQFPAHPAPSVRKLGYNTPREGPVKPAEEQITELLHEAAGGNREAFDRLYELVFPELLAKAAARMRRETPGQSIGASDLAMEAFLRAADQRAPAKNRRQFYGMFEIMMKRVLLDRIRKKLAEANGGGWRRVTLHPNLSMPRQEAEKLLAVQQCLERLEQDNPRQGKIVELRFYCGLSNTDIAEYLGISLSTVEADWRFAKAWLRMELEDRRWP